MLGGGESEPSSCAALRVGRGKVEGPRAGRLVCLKVDEEPGRAASGVGAEGTQETGREGQCCWNLKKASWVGPCGSGTLKGSLVGGLESG